MPAPMNPEIKAEWLKRLRDPEAKQTTGALCREKPYTNAEGRMTPEGMCCLGILTEIGVEKGVIQRTDDPYDGELGTVGYLVTVPTEEGRDDYTYTETGTLPEPLVKWSGLPDSNPFVVGPDRRRITLATLNDRGATFSEIADLIDAQF